MADRGLTPVVGKAAEAGVVVLFIGLLTTALFGSAVPGAQRTAGDAVGDRTLALAGERVQQAVPPEARATDVAVRVDLPRTIAGRAYRIETDGRALVLVHPAPAIGRRATLALPDHVVRVEGAWESRETTLVRVTTTGTGVTVRLTSA